MKNYLIGIGIDVYESSNIQNLNNAVKDTEEICRILTSKYSFEDAIFLINSKATNENIHKLLKEIQLKITVEDNLFLYYAGHGTFDDGINVGYWIPYDAQPQLITTYFPNSSLVSYIKSLKAKHILLFSDSCFSRSILLESDSRCLLDYENQKSRWAMTSGRNAVLDGIAGKNSPFAEYIIKYLNNQKNNFLISDLIQYVKISISAQLDQNPQGYPLSGVGHEGGEFIFKPVSKRRGKDIIFKDELKGYSDIAKILQLYEPKSQFKEFPSIEDRSQKIGYSLFLRENKAIKQVEYYLYLYKGIIQSTTYDSLKKLYPEIFKKKNLIILIPREETQKKQDVRKKNIQDKFNATNVFYIDEFIWNLCTPRSFTEITTDSKFLDINNFVTPKVQDEDNKELEFNNLIEWLSKQNEQVLVLKGSGGIGKTTIAKNISDIFQEKSDINGKQRKSLFIESTEIIDELKRSKQTEQELNIYSFYEADYLRNGYSQEKLNNDLFKVNLDNGNLLVVIDGLDEIISKVPNFDVNIFLSSIFDSYNEIGNAKVIITCRSHFWDKSKFSDEYSLKTVELLPFDEPLAKKFFDKSFGTNRRTERCIKIAKEFVSKDNDLEVYEFQPYVLDVIKNIVDSDGALLTNDFSFESNYLIQDIKSDYIIYNVCRREIKRIEQISVDEQIKFFISLSVNYDGVIAESKLPELVNKSSNIVDSTKIEALKSHPFISTYNGKISFKYDFLNDIFKGIYLKSLMNINNDEPVSFHLIKLISDNCWLNSGLIQEVVNRIKSWTDDEILKIVYMIESIQKFDTTPLIKNKAISGVFALSLRINHAIKGNNIDNNTKLLEDIFIQENNTIKNLCIINFSSYEKAIKFDFSDKILYKCYIDNFSDFWICKFNENTCFSECTLYNLQNDSEIPIEIKESQFQNCTKDSFINEVFKNSALKEKNIELKVKQFIELFFNLFLSKGRIERQSYKDRIKWRYSGIKPNLLKLDKLLEILERDNVLDVYLDDKYNEKKVKITDDYKMDISKFCKEGTMSVRIQKIIKILSDELSL